jgi:glutamate dehydrogenase (NADP+)
MTEILKVIKARDPNEKEFHQAVEEVVDSVKPVLDRNPQYRENGILERLVEPERVVMFQVPWVDDEGQAQVIQGPDEQRHRALQGRTSISSIREPQHPQVSRF